MAFLDNKEVGKRLKEKRKLTNLSARAFAIKADVDQSQYAKIEKGELPITENIMEKLVMVHDLDRDSILHGTNVPRETLNNHHKPTEAQHAPDWRDEVIALLKEKVNLNERKMLVMLQRNHALLNAIVETLPKLVSKGDKAKLLEAHEEMNKRIEHHLDALKKENT